MADTIRISIEGTKRLQAKIKRTNTISRMG